MGILLQEVEYKNWWWRKALEALDVAAKKEASSSGAAENSHRPSPFLIRNNISVPFHTPDHSPQGNFQTHLHKHKCSHDNTSIQTMARRRRPPRPGALTELPPLKILSQIVILQTIWYGVATALILFTALVAGKSFSFDLVLSWRSLRGDTTVGWMLGLVWLLNSLFGYASLFHLSISSFFLVRE